MIKSRYLNRNYIEPFGMVLKRTKIQVKPKFVQKFVVLYDHYFQKQYI